MKLLWQCIVYYLFMPGWKFIILLKSIFIDLPGPGGCSVMKPPIPKPPGRPDHINFSEWCETCAIQVYQGMDVCVGCKHFYHPHRGDLPSLRKHRAELVREQLIAANRAKATGRKYE